MNAWEEYAAKLADKLMDAGNITFAALIVGQILSARPFRWEVAVLGFIAWLGFYSAAFFVVRWKRRE